MFLITLAVLVGAVLIVLPVWLAAKLFRAKKSGFFRCFFAALLSSLAFQVVSAVVGIYLGIVLGVVAMAAVYQILLRMGFWSGLGVALAVALLQALVYGLVMVALGELLQVDVDAPAAGMQWVLAAPQAGDPATLPASAPA